MDKLSYSRVECFKTCPKQYQYRYIDKLQTLPADEPDNVLIVGQAMHKAIEQTPREAIKQYYNNYPIISDEHITEALKIEILANKIVLPPSGEYESEVHVETPIFTGFIDLIVKNPDGTYSIVDYKYTSSPQLYEGSSQLHLYKYFYEQTTGRKVKDLFYIFIPKINLKQQAGETLIAYRKRLINQLNKSEITVKKIKYDPTKIRQFLDDATKTITATVFEKKPSFMCKWCEFKDYCKEGADYMIVPEPKPRQIGDITSRKIWIYGPPFSGKTTFADKAPVPLSLNTDGNIKFVTMQYIPIKDDKEGRMRILAWEKFKEAISELEKSNHGYKTLIVDLFEDTYEYCRLYMYDKLDITHESDASFSAWDKVRTEFLSTIKRVLNLDFENIILLSQEDTSSDLTRKSGEKLTKVKPNIPEKIASKVAGMVDIVARVVCDDDNKRTLNFRSDEFIFGGGRLQNLSKTKINLDWDELCAIYEQATTTQQQQTPTEETRRPSRPSRASGN